MAQCKLFLDTKMWQRFIHFFYINDLSDHLFKSNCEEIISAGLRYANLTKNNSTNVSRVIHTLETDYIESFRRDIKTLQTLEMQNQPIEKALPEIIAPFIYKKLRLWKPIFEKWAEIYENAESCLHDIICTSVQDLINEKKDISKFALNIGLKNPNKDIHKLLKSSLQCKCSYEIRLLLKKIVLKEDIPRCPYERGNVKHLFVTEKAFKNYLGSCDISRIQKSLFVPLMNQQSIEHKKTSQLITDSSSTPSSSLTSLRKRKMSDISPSKYNELGISSIKRRKLHYSSESLFSIVSENNENEERDCFGSFTEEQNDFNNKTDEAKLVYSDDKTGQAVINEINFSEERKNMSMQIKALQMELEETKEMNKILTADRDDKIEEIAKLQEDLKNQENQKVLEELELRTELESARNTINDLENDREKMILQMDRLQKDLEKIKERVEKVHQEREENQEPEETYHVCPIA